MKQTNSITEAIKYIKPIIFGFLAVKLRMGLGIWIQINKNEQTR